ncbi:LYR motif-containing protein 4 [Powellomyces hirtus]|nr:LYR motif-containing protein 4 [Powellomyces hirtus]
MAPSTTPQVLSLYRSLLRAGRVFHTHNYRDYVHRRTRDAFRAAAGETDPVKIAELIAAGQRDLEVTRRQAWLNAQFKADKSVVEHA